MQGTDERYVRLAKKLKALAHPGRLKLLARLLDGDCCVGEIQTCVSLSQPRVSQSLKRLKDAGIVESRRLKRRRCYRIVDGPAVEALKILLEGERSHEAS